MITTKAPRPTLPVDWGQEKYIPFTTGPNVEDILVITTVDTPDDVTAEVFEVLSSEIVIELSTDDQTIRENVQSDSINAVFSLCLCLLLVLL